MKVFNLFVCALLAILSGNASSQDLQRPDRISFLEVFAKSNDPECLELNFDGVSLHVRITPANVTFFLSPIFSHYNPDFLVASYPRLGDSPLFESYVALGTAQNIIAKPVVELLSGADAPETFGVKREWGSGKGTDAGRDSKKTLSFYETEVFGHPGNIYTWASRAYRGETVLDPSTLGNLVSAVPDAAASIPQRINSAISEVGQRSETTLGNGFSIDALRRIDPIELATNAVVGEVADLYNSSGIGSAINSVRDVLPDSVEESLVASSLSYGSGFLQRFGNQASSATGGIGASGETPEDLEPDEPFSLEGLGDDVRTELIDQLGQLTPEAIGARIEGEIADLQGQVTEFQELFESLNQLVTPESLSALVPGVSAQILPFNGLCPSDVEPFQPYYLSGANILSWRYKLPEIVYPQTYIPFSNSTTIGTLFPGGSTNPLAAISSLGEVQNYGSVYPRNGYQLQSHPLKAAAVAAFRATHVVTRPRQPHIYRHPDQKSYRRIMMLNSEYETNFEGDNDRDGQSTYLEPDVPETGRWNLVHNPGGEEDKHCARFGSSVTNEKLDTDNPIKLIGEVANTFTDQWADDKASEDNSYVFSMWRRYRCAPRPSSGGLFSTTFHLYNLPNPIGPIPILHSGENIEDGE